MSKEATKKRIAEYRQLIALRKKNPPPDGGTGLGRLREALAREEKELARLEREERLSRARSSGGARRSLSARKLSWWQ